MSETESSKPGSLTSSLAHVSPPPTHASKLSTHTAPFAPPETPKAAVRQSGRIVAFTSYARQESPAIGHKTYGFPMTVC